MGPKAVKRALLSVSDKRGIVELAQGLDRLGVTLISTGGTAALLRKAGLGVQDVSELTGFPEMMDGRVKTLHPAVHGGLLGDRDKAEHRSAMEGHGIAGIDLLVVNLYPFEDTVASGAAFETAIENIDIGGPAMIRSAAKNHAHVGVVVDPGDYPDILEALSENGGLDTDHRRRLAAKAFARTAAYDGAIGAWLAQTLGEPTPEWRSLSGRLRQTLRYGENPHQTAAFYVTGAPRPGIATARQVQGKELSYNNLNDTDAAFELVCEFDPKDAPAVAIIKHANPCGVAIGPTARVAFEKALLCDPVSAFGGIIALNTTLDRQTAELIGERFTEVIIAPDAEESALAFLASKKNLRVLLTGGLADPLEPGDQIKSVAGGFLVQSRDAGRVLPEDWQVVTQREPTPAEATDLLFAFKVAKHVKSNAIVHARHGATVGIGAGQMSRVDSARIAAQKGQDAADTVGLPDTLTKGSVAASDAFFPFPDGMLQTVEAGATAVIQPGGAMRDDEVIAAADKAGVAMVLTGMRHFRH
ncbi:MAG: bifunctional phosphoribosylaminoimidazolecarboxamide formyltransferase/IMP cyclohydrolase [Alphaproteobacteria bacterium]